MPTNTKPRKPRNSSKHEVEPGQVWLDLSALYQDCCSLMRNGTTTAPILKDPTFIENTEHVAEVTAIAKTIATKLPSYLDRLKAIHVRQEQFRAEWNRLNDLRHQASKNRDLSNVQNYRGQMDNYEFHALSIGEQYQTWIADWQQDVNLDIIHLLSLIELTRRAMEEKQNVAK